MSTVEQTHRRRRPRAHRLQPVDAVRGVPEVHGGRRGGPPDRRHAHSTGRPRSAASSASGTPRSPSSIPTTASPGAAPSGAENAGVVTFHRLDDDTTRVMVQIDYEPEGARREGRRHARRRRPPREGRPRALQGAHRGARHRDRRLARRGRGAAERLARPAAPPLAAFSRGRAVPARRCRRAGASPPCPWRAPRAAPRSAGPTARAYRAAGHAGRPAPAPARGRGPR